jgi:steroid delta-isomerase-like uncharacterized protein/uncharacterized protein (TIGR02246 family)
MRTALGSLAIPTGIVCLAACADATPPPAPAPVTAQAPPAAPATDTASPAPAPKPSMPDMIAATLKAWTDALNAHDAQKYAAVFATDGIRRTVPDPNQVGRDAIAKAVSQGILTTLPDYKIAIEKVLEKGNIAVIEATFTGTDTVGTAGAKPSGRPVGLEIASVATFGDDGLIKELHVYADKATLEQQTDPKAKVGTFRARPTLPASFDVVMGGGPNEDANLQATRVYYQALDDHKVDAALAFVTDDSVSEAYTDVKVLKGTKEWRTWFQKAFTAFPDMKGPATGQSAIGDYVVSEGILTGTFKAQLGIFKPTGKPVSVPYLDVIEWKGGKIAHLQTYSEGKDFLTQIGVAKPPKPAQ